MTTDTTRTEAISKLAKLIKDIRIAMLTTTETDGTLRSRPMGTQQIEFDGDLWFFTGADSGKVNEIQHDQHVNLSYAAPEDNRYVSVSGTAQLVRDQNKVKELWNPLLKAWFPNGPDDPNIALLKIDVQAAEYWDSPSSAVVQVIGFAKAVVTGKPYNGGENEKLSL